MECCRVREFLSQVGVPYDDRNIADNPDARAELIARIGDVLVPTLVCGGQTIVGYDAAAMEAVLRQGISTPDTGFDGLPTHAGAGAPAEPASDQDAIAANLAEFLAHLEHEMRVNAAKGSQPYRHGVHDGLRFAADGIRKILAAGELPNEGRRALPGSS